MTSYASKAFDRLLGGGFFVISFAGGLGLYSLNSWINNSIHFKTNNMSHYTFSGRTSCMSLRDLGGYKKRTEVSDECLAKIAQHQLNRNNDIDDDNDNGSDSDNDHDNDIRSMDFDNSVDSIGGRMGTALLMNYRELGEQGHDGQGEEGQEESCVHVVPCQLQRETSPTILDLLPCMISVNTDTDTDDDADSSSHPLPRSRSPSPSSPQPQPQRVKNTSVTDIDLFGVNEDDTLCLHQQLKLYLEQYISDDDEDEHE